MSEHDHDFLEQYKKELREVSGGGHCEILLLRPRTNDTRL